MASLCRELGEELCTRIRWVAKSYGVSEDELLRDLVSSSLDGLGPLTLHGLSSLSYGVFLGSLAAAPPW